MEIKTIEIENQKVNLKFNKLFGWRVVYPWKKEYNDGKINYTNLLFGGKANLINLIILLVIAGMLLFGVSEMVASCRELAKNPCDYCRQQTVQGVFSGDTGMVSSDSLILIEDGE